MPQFITQHPDSVKGAGQVTDRVFKKPKGQLVDRQCGAIDGFATQPVVDESVVLGVRLKRTECTEIVIGPIDADARLTGGAMKQIGGLAGSFRHCGT
jgi:hypothetical protein